MKGRIIVVGASTSGIAALTRLIQALPADLPAAVIVVQHVAPHSPNALPQILGRMSALPVEHARDLQPIEPGRIYVAPPDRHLMVRKSGYLRLTHGPKENRVRPAIDVTFRSAAVAYGAATVGVVLTGYLDDGTSGLLAIKDCGGIAIVQEPTEAAAPSMPLSALQHVAVDHRCELAQIAVLLVDLARDRIGTTRSLGALMEIEDRIAEGSVEVDDWTQLEHMCEPAGLQCPNCRSSLFEVNDNRVLRFRCRAGHAFSAQSLLSGQVEARDDLVAATLGAVREEAALARRMSARHEFTARAGQAAHLLAQARELEDHARQLAHWQRDRTGLVNPDPIAQLDLEPPGPAPNL